nr:MAG TPA: hypothetical protein [Caudoviricetes sp.]
MNGTLLLLTLTHPKRITAIQLRSVSALSSLAVGTAHRKVLLWQNRYSICTAFVGWAGGDIHCGFTPCIS